MLTKPLILALSALLYSSAIIAQIKLSGEIAGLTKIDTVELYDQEKGQYVNSSKVENGHFNMVLSALPYKKYLLILKGAFMGNYLWIDGTNIHVTAKLENFKRDELKESNEFLANIVISGSRTQQEEDGFYRGIASDLRLLDTLLRPVEYIYNIQPTFTDYESIPRRTDSIRKIIIEKKKRYVQTHPKSLFSSFLLLHFLRDHILNTKDYYTIYSQFSRDNKHSYYGEILNSILQDGYSPIRTGEHFVDIALQDTSNITRKLSDMKGKLIILNFWWSHCPNSILDHDFHLSLYNKYNKSGLEIFSVSVDANAAEWKKASKDGHIPWINVAEQNGFLGKTALKYGVSFAPRDYLISRNGLILDTLLRIDFPETEDRIKALLSK